MHSPSVSSELELKTSSFIVNLHRSLNRLLAIFFAIFCVLLISNSVFLSFKIGRLISSVIDSIKEYAHRPEEYYTIRSRMLALSLKDPIVKPILHNLESVIKSIEAKKKKFKSKCKTIKLDHFPLNMLEHEFNSEHRLQDQQLFE